MTRLKEQKEEKEAIAVCGLSVSLTVNATADLAFLSLRNVKGSASATKGVTGFTVACR
ncbi:hypothetical protein M2387_000988 [Klebsiella sp. BIGb0407]|nr:hypothetical protein [Klebsiella sp. BIGb0407]